MGALCRFLCSHLRRFHVVLAKGKAPFLHQRTACQSRTLLSVKLARKCIDDRESNKSETLRVPWHREGGLDLFPVHPRGVLDSCNSSEHF
eukprot:1520372-Amphidinium_carterae.1